MRFSLNDEQRSFASAIDGLLAGADVPAVNRAWGTGDTAPGLALWGRLAELGVPALTVPEEAGGIGASPLDLVVAFELLGRHGVPGPWIESVAVAPLLLAETPHADLLEGLAEGTVRATLAVEGIAPYAVDADAATHVFHASSAGLAVAEAGEAMGSVDPSRRLFPVTPGAHHPARRRRAGPCARPGRARHRGRPGRRGRPDAAHRGGVRRPAPPVRSRDR